MRGEAEAEGIMIRRTDRGFGFVQVHRDGAPTELEVYLHANDCDGQELPLVGDRLRFKLIMTFKGGRAVQARLA